jgi:cytochrome c551
MRTLPFYLLLIVLFISCQQGNPVNENPLAEISDPKVMQLAIPGKILYETQCANCHQKNGEGLGKLIPPLQPSDYMSTDIPRTIKVIKNGLAGEILVNGIKYNEKMPAFDHLTDLEIAQLSTYIYNVWGNKKGVISSKMVKEALSTN